MPNATNFPEGSAPAVVVGLCAHGLALARALALAGTRVIALEANAALPGFRTRHADVRQVPDINGPGLIDALETLRTELPTVPQPVLHVTNDNMVRTVATHWERLEPHYRLSWSGCRNDVLRLLNKSGLESHCQAHDLPYPESRLLESPETITEQVKDLAFPAIVKPARPLSGFKVRLMEDEAALHQLAAAYPQAFPLLLQQWIRGDDRRLLFAAFYLDQGRVLATFCGRKLESSPPAMGQTTVAEAAANDEVHALAERFFAPLGLSGPVSLEVKLDPDGRPWIVEPTVGRTDYWLDCCVANGVNFPAVEQAHQTQAPLPEVRQTDAVIWFDTERSPTSYLRYRLNSLRTGLPAKRPRFPYWGNGEWAPFWQGSRRLATSTVQRLARRLTS